jgi:hypothetical protein
VSEAKAPSPDGDGSEEAPSAGSTVSLNAAPIPAPEDSRGPVFAPWCFRNSILAMVSRCTSSGPSAKRSVRECA